jgi:hypothetical protein
MNLERVSDKQKANTPAKPSVNHDAPRTRLIAGVSVADNPLITAVIDKAVSTVDLLMNAPFDE